MTTRKRSTQLHIIRRQINLLGVGLVVGLVLSTPTVAADLDWELRAYGQWLSSSEGGTNRTGEIAVSGDVGDGTGAGVGAQAWLTRRFGLGLDVATGSLDLAIAIEVPTLPPARADSEIELTSVTASLPFALHRGDRHSLYLAPFLSWVSFDDVTLVFESLADTSVTYDVESDTGTGLRLGYDRALGARRWALHAHLDYLATRVDGVNPENPVDRLELDPDPYALAVGLVWRR